MTVVNVDTQKPENFEKKNFDPVPVGTYLLEVSNDLVVETAKSSGNNKVDVIVKVIDDKEDGKYRGRTIFETIALTPKSEWRLIHLAMACGSQTKAEIESAGGVDISLIRGRAFQAKVGLDGARTDPSTGQVYSARNRISQYMFDEPAMA